MTNWGTICNTKWAKALPWPDIISAALEQHVPFFLLAAVVQTESSGLERANRYEPGWKYFYQVEEFAKKLGTSKKEEMVGQKHSYGLCQIMGTVARELGFCGSFDDLYDVGTNLKYGAMKLRECLDRYHYNWWDAVAAYNAGSVRRKPNGEYVNQVYVDRVRGVLNALCPRSEAD